MHLAGAKKIISISKKLHGCPSLFIITKKVYLLCRNLKKNDSSNRCRWLYRKLFGRKIK
jgi:hypothetical protein